MIMHRSFIAVVLLLSASSCNACTAIGIGKDVSSTGYPIISHSEDGGGTTNDIRLIRVPRKKWPAGSMRNLNFWQDAYPRVVSSQHSPEMAPVGDQKESETLAQIPQVPETWAYWDTEYGVQNEKGLAMGGGTCTSRTVGWPVRRRGEKLPYGFNHVGIEDLSKIALERCETARCAVETMGAIAVEQGFYCDDAGTPEEPAYGDGSECLLVGDVTDGELWAFHVLTGKNNRSAIWAAERIPSDHVAAIANAFTIGKMNLSDKSNFLYSPGITELAEENGWRHPGEKGSSNTFDFFYAYGYSPEATNPEMVAMANRLGKSPAVMAKTENNINAYYSGRRMWRIFSLLSPSEGAKLDPNREHLPHTMNVYPASVPARKGSVTPRMVMNVHRDHYEGTPYDLTKGMAAGPFGNPNRGAVERGVLGQWERALSMERTNWCFVNEPRQGGRSIMWFAYDSPHGSVFLPFYAAAAHAAPESYHSHEGTMSNFSYNVAWWAYNLINQYTEINFQLINADVRKKANEVEDEAQRRVAAWEAEADRLLAAAPTEKGEREAMEFLTRKSNEFAEEILAEWQKFSTVLFGKFGRHLVTYNESLTGVSTVGQQLPAWWLSSPEVGFTTWSESGPFHGVTLDATMMTSSDVAAAAASESMAIVQGKIGGSSMLVTLSFTVVLMVLVSAGTYKLGLKHARQSPENENMGYYILTA